MISPYQIRKACRGVVILWKTRELEVLCSFKGVSFLRIKVIWKEKFYYLFNVYSACVLSMKRVLWNKLLDLKSKYSDGEWLIGSEFNAVKDGREIAGRTFVGNNSEWDELFYFVNNIDLADIPCKGKRFSWFGGVGTSKIRIDLFLVSNNIMNWWGVAR